MADNEKNREDQKVKVQLLLNNKDFASLKRLKTRTGRASQADAVYFAIDLILQIMDALDESAGAKRLCLRTKSGEIQRMMLPFVEH